MRRWLIPGALALLAMAAPAAALDVSPSGMPRVVGVPGDDPAALSLAGDVNGDGSEDFLIGAASAAPLGRDQAGAAWVIFGGGPPVVDVRMLGSAGFEIRGPAERGLLETEEGKERVGAGAGAQVAPMGDLNRDGYGDVAVVAPFASLRGRDISGSAYVVFGRPGSAPVDLGALGAQGYRIDGPARASFLGVYTASPGDFDGDGRADLALASAKGTLVVGGRAEPGIVDLATPQPGVLTIGSGRTSGKVASAGDIDGDGRGDLLIATRSPRESSVGYAVFGGPLTGALDLSKLGARGYSVTAPRGEHFGPGLAGLGDVNGDGRPDAAFGIDPDSDRAKNAVIVVWGQVPGTRVVAAALTPFTGYSIARSRARPRSGPDLSEDGDRLGESVAGVGDLDGDGLSELLVGAPGARPSCRAQAGAAYLIQGGARAGRLPLASLAGTRFDGPRRAGVSLGLDLAPGPGRSVLLGLFPSDDDTPGTVLSAVPGPPGPLAATPRGSDCFEVKVLDRTIRTVLRRGAIRVRVRLDSGDGKGGAVGLGFNLDTRSEARSFRYVTVHLRRAGTRTVSVPLKPRGRRELRRARRVRLSGFATLDSRAPGTDGSADTDVILRR